MIMRVPAGWTASGRGLSRKYRRKGWTVFHCGHPTANWPWGVEDPEGVLHTSGDACHLGYSFRHVGDALAHVERHLKGA